MKKFKVGQVVVFNKKFIEYDHLFDIEFKIVGNMSINTVLLNSINREASQNMQGEINIRYIELKHNRNGANS